MNHVLNNTALRLKNNVQQRVANLIRSLCFVESVPLYSENWFGTRFCYSLRYGHTNNEITHMLFMCGFFNQVSNIQKTKSYYSLDTYCLVVSVVVRNQKHGLWEEKL